MKSCALLSLIWLLTTASAYGLDLTTTIRTVPELHEHNSNSPFASVAASGGFAQDQTRQELEVRAHQGDINLVATARHLAREQHTPEYNVLLNELYYEFSLKGERFSLGKKIISWDVGFGFRPLDLIQRENRRTLVQSTLEGVPCLSWEHFSGNSAWQLVYTWPGNGKADQASHDESIAVRFYHHLNTVDLHAVLRVTERQKLETGMAYSSVIGDGVELHGSILYQMRYEQRDNPLIHRPDAQLVSSNPLVVHSEHQGGKALLGFTVTGESGFSLIGEAWYDMQGYTATDWRRLNRMIQRLRSLASQGAPASAIDGSIAYNLAYFNSTSLLRENLLLRLSHRQEGSNWEPALELLGTPADGGVVATASLAYTGNRYRLESGIRQFTGACSSAWRMLPEEQIIYLSGQVSW